MMGEFTVKAEICGFKGCETIEALVDTGSSYTAIPKSVAERVGIRKHGKVEFELGDGRTKIYDVGYVNIKLNGRDGLVRVAIIEDGAEPKIGAVTLEDLGFVVDPVEMRLKPKKRRL